MIEIITGIWLTSFVLSSLMVGWNLWAIRRQLSSHSLAVLNSNLAKANLYWSNTNSDFAPLESDAIELDRTKAMKNAALLGLCCFASLPGFLFVTVVVVSMRFLARERKEQAVFHIELTRIPDLAAEVVKNLVENLRQIT